MLPLALVRHCPPSDDALVRVREGSWLGCPTKGSVQNSGKILEQWFLTQGVIRMTLEVFPNPPARASLWTWQIRISDEFGVG